MQIGSTLANCLVVGLLYHTALIHGRVVTINLFAKLVCTDLVLDQIMVVSYKIDVNTSNGVEAASVQCSLPNSKTMDNKHMCKIIYLKVIDVKPFNLHYLKKCCLQMVDEVSCLSLIITR